MPFRRSGAIALSYLYFWRLSFLLPLKMTPKQTHLPPKFKMTKAGRLSSPESLTIPFYNSHPASHNLFLLLEDQAGFVNRDLSFIFPLESQVLGNLTSDFYSPPVDYNINLPIEPRGTLVDVDNDDSEDVGVMVYTPAYWTNTFGDPFLDQRDAAGGGWSGAYAGTLVNAEQEITGGMYVIYAPEDGQGFPSGFGEDGLLFTEDDPIVTVPQGWTTLT